jgi:DNA primase
VPERDGPSLDEFKARLPLAEIVARYVQLRRAGRELVGLCPFHQERTPSFSVVEAKGFYHCFGCGAHGNAIDFIMALERIDFAAALERLSTLTGIPAPRLAAQADAPRLPPGLVEANEAACAVFRRELSASGGATARAYLERRGVDAKTAAAFELGWAPAGRNTLREALIGRGFELAVLVDAGLLVTPEDGGEPYDRFRERLIFPIRDPRGRVVGFGGRALGDAKPKYLNTPETALFHKGELLYNHPAAAGPARARGELILAEGYMDVIALAQAGLAHAAAPLGTALTERQLELAWRLAAEPILCLDGDPAGQRAALRAADRALPLLRPGRSLRVALLPPGEDPDSLLRSHGADALSATLARSLPLVEFLWRNELALRPPDTPERRADLQRRLRERVRSIGDVEVRRLYADEFRSRTDGLWQRGGGGRRATEVHRPVAPLPDPRAARFRPLLQPLLVDPALLREAEDELAAIELPHPDYDALRREILNWFAVGEPLDAACLHNHLTRYGFERMVDQILAKPAASPAHAAALARGWRDNWPAAVRAYRRRHARAVAVDEAYRGLAEVDQPFGRLDRLLNEQDERDGAG